VEKHTLEHFREELWRPTLLTRQPYGVWAKKGAKDMSQRISEKVREIIETHRPPALPEKTLAALEEIKIKGEKELTGSVDT
jgi:trimethylamine--corrinoid protein Co-methyltransferase